MSYSDQCIYNNSNRFIIHWWRRENNLTMKNLNKWNWIYVFRLWFIIFVCIQVPFFPDFKGILRAWKSDKAQKKRANGCVVVGHHRTCFNMGRLHYGARNRSEWDKRQYLYFWVHTNPVPVLGRKGGVRGLVLPSSNRKTKAWNAPEKGQMRVHL